MLSGRGPVPARDLLVRVAAGTHGGPALPTCSLHTCQVAETRWRQVLGREGAGAGAWCPCWPGWAGGAGRAGRRSDYCRAAVFTACTPGTVGPGLPARHDRQEVTHNAAHQTANLANPVTDQPVVLVVVLDFSTLQPHHHRVFFSYRAFCIQTRDIFDSA